MKEIPQIVLYFTPGHCTSKIYIFFKVKRLLDVVSLRLSGVEKGRRNEKGESMERKTTFLGKKKERDVEMMRDAVMV